MKLIPVILSGGAGARLWPLSRALHPKPFIRLKDGVSLLQKAFLRGALLPGVEEIWTVTNRDLFFKTEDEFCEVNAAKIATTFILEPYPRNTAPAIAAAALLVAKTQGKGAMMLILPADHLIADEQAFEQAVLQAIKIAIQDKVVTFGVQPNSPHTGYGYIEVEGDTVRRFVEKPSLEKAKEYLASGCFFWNSGMFCFTVETILQQMEQYCPEILQATSMCIEQSRFAKGKGFKQLELDPKSFQNIPDQSIDYAVMEKSDQIAVVSCNIGWTDIGSWSALGNLDAPNSQGNRIRGKALLHNTQDCTVHSNNRLVSTVGVRDLVIIDTEDAVLVANKSSMEEVKHVYAELKALDHEAHKCHRKVYRPWGTYTVLEEGEGFKIKRIEVKPGASLSLQMHRHRSEHWVVTSGEAKVINGDREITIKLYESTFIPAGHKHRLMNQGMVPCVIIEIQCGDYVGEDDIVRFEDAYGRL